jgi:hypothetical protein
MFLAIELCLTAVCIALAIARPQLGDAFFSHTERLLSRWSLRQGVSALMVGLLALGIRIALLPLLPIPLPQVDDEFSHLLLSDTLAHGRLANPTHPMWVHFETFFVNWHPTYASMYYPGHALWLALGQVALGHPFWGVLLSSALMCTAICWALQGWMPPQWALLGALMVVIRVASFSYWSNSYWGGSATALGGALVFGAVPRIRDSATVRDSILLGFGLAILAITRPYEGLFFSLPLLVVLAWWVVRGNASLPTKFGGIAPALVIVAVGLVWLGYYFWRVTGSPFTTPYQLNMREYGMIYFPWNQLKPVHFRHPGLEAFYRGPAVVDFLQMARHRPWNVQALKAIVIWLFYFGPVLTVPIIAWISVRGRRSFTSFKGNSRILLAVALLSYLAFTLPFSIGQPHYIAPALVVIYAILLLMMRDLYQVSASGRFLVRWVPVICLLLFCARVAAPLLRLSPRTSWIRSWCSKDPENTARATIQAELERTPGNHVAIVRYAPNHDFILDEWVFNDADVDGSKVIWARDMGTKNAELVNYFNTRKIWLVEPDYTPPRLAPYAH